MQTSWDKETRCSLAENERRIIGFYAWSLHQLQQATHGVILNALSVAGCAVAIVVLVAMDVIVIERCRI